METHTEHLPHTKDLPLRGPTERGRLVTCLVRGHRWDVAPRRDTKQMTCVRCGLSTEPVA